MENQSNTIETADILESNQNSIKIKEEVEDDEETIPPQKRQRTDLWIYSTDDYNVKSNVNSSTKNRRDPDQASQASSLDEGEIVDDEINDKFEEGECEDIKKEILSDIKSNYSDWSESDDGLLKGDDSIAPVESPVRIKLEPNDNDIEIIPVKVSPVDLIDLEAISDDDDEFETMATDNSYSGKNGKLEKLFQKENYQIQEKELEEISILDTLKIDWASLLEDKQQKEQQLPQNITSNQSVEDHEQTGKAQNAVPPPSKEDQLDKKRRSEEFRKQNSTLAMLNRIGFSQEFAGPKLTSFINEYLKQKLQDDYQPMLHPVPALNAFYKNQQNQNKNILGTNSGVVMSGDKDRLFHELVVNYPFL